MPFLLTLRGPDVIGNITDGTTPDVTCDFFHKYEEDILEMKRLGINTYRFSISWPRLFPESSRELNLQGVAFYNNVIDCLVRAATVESSFPYIKTFKDFSFYVNQQGSIGMVADVQWYEPLSDIQEDRDAVIRCNEFNMGWILDPVFFGDYPKTMREILGEKLPNIDFLGLNYYFALWVTKAAKIKPLGMHTWLQESQTNLFWINNDGKLLVKLLLQGPYESAMFRSCPWGLRKVLAGLNSRYGNIPIYITENGIKDSVIVRTLDERLNDQWRVKFLHDHIQALSESISEDKVNVKGYFHWSFTDTWEWFSGYAPHFGLYFIDFEDPLLQRTPKASAKWFASFLKS
ncbi:hypothetical protein KP509_30G014200 [Ceratopteris richardii]|uniref:Beta-glucosidase n=1 Tax=Ceratopteris richardii TaxID=49495 RepID=A0A8T2R1J2_CERRI|nr:hypothetical protein KP509_30G014200 [Ceratopteris richardii]